MRFGVDIEVQLVAGLTPGGTGLVLGSVGHDDRNHMIIRMNFGFHGFSFGAPAPVSNLKGDSDLAGSITHATGQNKLRNGSGQARIRAVPDLPAPPRRAYLGAAKTVGIE